MKIKYEFANETVEIDVSEEWGNILIDLDRQEYNTNHRETRRHCSLDVLNLDDAYLPSDVNVEQEVFAGVEAERLNAAISKLNPRQQYLVTEVFFKCRSQADIAAEEGVGRSAISHALDRAVNKLKKF